MGRLAPGLQAAGRQRKPSLIYKTASATGGLERQPRLVKVIEQNHEVLFIDGQQICLMFIYFYCM